jgi:fibronectin-binding autotransporter adhesin
VNVPAGSRSSGGLWLPPFDSTKFNGLVPVSVSSFPRVGLIDTNGNANLSDFTIQSADPEIVDGAVVEFILELDQPDPLFCATSPDVIVANWFRNVVPWSFDIHDEKTQKAGVTILHNIINPDLGEVTTLHYVLEKKGTVTISVYDLAGDLVRVLARTSGVAAGDYLQTWDGKNASGKVVARGVYFIRIVGPGIDEVRKVLVTR